MFLTGAKPRKGIPRAATWVEPDPVAQRITGTAGAASRTVGLKELRARRSRTVRLTVPVPRSARGRVCVRVAANAASARGAGSRRCAHIAGAPSFTG